MRCLSCNKVLTEYETSVRSAESNKFIDMCLDCLSHVEDDVAYYGNVGLIHDYEDKGD